MRRTFPAATTCGRGGPVGGDPEHPREVVPAPARHDAERRRAPRERPRRLLHGAVAAAHDDALGAAGDERAGELGRLAGGPRQHELGRKPSAWRRPTTASPARRARRPPAAGLAMT